MTNFLLPDEHTMIHKVTVVACINEQGIEKNDLFSSLALIFQTALVDHLHVSKWEGMQGG